MNLDNNQSFYSKAQDMLLQYKLPPIQNLNSELSTKEKWKSQVRKAVNNYWSEKLKVEAKGKSTSANMNIDSLNVGKHTMSGKH